MCVSEGCGCTGILGTNATPFFIRFPVPPCYSAYLVLGQWNLMFSLEGSDTFMVCFLSYYEFFLFHKLKLPPVQYLPKQTKHFSEIITYFTSQKCAPNHHVLPHAALLSELYKSPKIILGCVLYETVLLWV